MQLISKYNKGLRFLLYIIDCFNKFIQVVPQKDKRGTAIANVFQFQKISRIKANKIWVDQSSEFYYNPLKNG